jgi:hypothetical protein
MWLVPIGLHSPHLSVWVASHYYELRQRIIPRQSRVYLRPAFSIRISSRGENARTVFAAFFIDSMELKSSSREVTAAAGIWLLTSARAARPFSGLRAAIQIRAALCFASSKHDCFHKPLLAPVTRMTFLSSDGISVVGSKDMLVLAILKVFQAVHLLNRRSIGIYTSWCTIEMRSGMNKGLSNSIHGGVLY